MDEWKPLLEVEVEEDHHREDAGRGTVSGIPRGPDPTVPNSQVRRHQGRTVMKYSGSEIKSWQTKCIVNCFIFLLFLLVLTTLVQVQKIAPQVLMPRGNIS